MATKRRWQFVGLGIVAIGIVPLRKRSGDESAAIHLSVVVHVERHLNGVATVYGITYGVAVGLVAWLQDNALLAAEGNRRTADKDFVKSNRFGTSQIGEPEAQL